MAERRGDKLDKAVSLLVTLDPVHIFALLYRKFTLKRESQFGGLFEMPLLIRKYKGNSGVMQEERIDDPDRIERYLRLFDKDDVKKLETGVKTVIEKDEWQLLP